MKLLEIVAFPLQMVGRSVVLLCIYVQIGVPLVMQGFQSFVIDSGHCAKNNHRGQAESSRNHKKPPTN